jgi:hypothetical protein
MHFDERERNIPDNIIGKTYLIQLQVLNIQFVCSLFQICLCYFWNLQLYKSI